VVNQSQRATAQRSLVEVLAEKRGLREGLTADRATDIVFSLVSHEMFLLLTVERGWSADEWEAWIIETVADAVLLR
jgi:hypothetical protein